MRMYKITFFTVLSGSRAISGMFASTISENKFKIRFEYLREKNRKKNKNRKKKTWVRSLHLFLISRILLEVVVLGALQ
jgi:hypothetical protein